MSDDAVRPVEPTAGGSADTVLAGLDSTASRTTTPRSRHTRGAPMPPEPTSTTRPTRTGPPPRSPTRPQPVSEGTQVVQDAPAPTPAQLRVDFGAHLEANYRRLVAQLYAITLDPAEAHSAVQDAYSRAWRSWAAVSRSPDSVGWVRRVAVRSTIRSWRRLRLAVAPTHRAGPGHRSTGAVLAALRELPAAERRCVVLHHMAGASGPGDRGRRRGLGGHHSSPARAGAEGRERRARAPSGFRCRLACRPGWTGRSAPDAVVERATTAGRSRTGTTTGRRREEDQR